MIRAALLLSAFCTPQAYAEDFEWDPIVDTAITVATNATWLSIYLAVDSGLGDQTRDFSTLDEDALFLFDRPFAGSWNNTSDTVSDILLYGSLAVTSGTVTTWGLRHEDNLVPLQIYAEAFGINSAITFTLKHAFSRPRPYTYATTPNDEMQEAMQNIDSTLSFPSGHTSLFAVSSFTTAAILAPHVEHARWLYGGATLLTATMGGLRVGAGKHFPTDVLVGGILGAAVGISTVSMHRTNRPKQVRMWAAAPEDSEGPVVWGMARGW